MTARAPRAEWRFVGSSFGGYVAARFAELHRGIVGRLLLLCPGFDLVRRWPELVGRDLLELWRRDGELAFDDGTGRQVPVHWRFYEEGSEHPPFPCAGVPTRILHGRVDTTVPIESSRRYLELCAQATLRELDDDHSLLASLPVVTAEALDFLAGPETTSP